MAHQQREVRGITTTALTAADAWKPTSFLDSCFTTGAGAPGSTAVTTGAEAARFRRAFLAAPSSSTIGVSGASSFTASVFVVLERFSGAAAMVSSTTEAARVASRVDFRAADMSRKQETP